MGKVVLIGAGPGAVDLITVRGARLLAQADVVLYDALVSEEMLELCPQAIKVPVGKRCGKPSLTQASINQQLVEYGLSYALVVRLKGGDPMLFGRADEELTALEQARIDVEVVPGITAALAAAAATLQPLTKRGSARSVAFFTSALANSPGPIQEPTIPNCDTLVQYMGGQQVQQTAKTLLAAGRSPELPVLIIENCSLPNQRTERHTLNDLTQEEAVCYQGPVLVMVGEVF